MFRQFRKRQHKFKLAGSFEITDDSGFLAIIDPDAYRGFIHSDWTWEMIQEHFLQEMSVRHLLIWHTGIEHIWLIDVSLEAVNVSGFRDILGGITASQGRLLLTNYESLTMAAGFPDVRLPQDHEREHLLTVSPGIYNCRIVQLSDPDSGAPFKERTNFIYEISKAVSPNTAWNEIPWGGA